ncbi:MAG: hypothetical protein MUO22_00605 [Sedimentisphaerales bacterium]|nr:hypothetical protein [Sedimentisphaerales bacterium]
MTIGEAIGLVADRLEAEQRTGGADTGSWPQEEAYNGSIVAGIATAFQRTCVQSYKTSAELGGDYTLAIAGGNYYGDEALALARLSQISDNPYDNEWKDALTTFYTAVENSTNGTSGYIAWFETGAEPSTAVFYVGHHVLGAYYVDANDKEIWRDSLVEFLATVDDSTSYFPVMALAIATWALAETGPLDSTLVDQDGTGRPYWNLKTLADLPGLLAGHQIVVIPEGIFNEWAGSFYWDFGHTDGGFTEDASFAVLGLEAAQIANPSFDYEEEIFTAKQVLFDSIDLNNGTVYESIWVHEEPTAYYFYAGELLTAMGELIIDGDINTDDMVDGLDMAGLADNWLTSSSGGCLCNGADIDQSDNVNFADFAALADNWLASDLI